MTQKPRLAVLIDAENISAKYAECIFEEIATIGEASVRRLYGDVSQAGIAPWLKKQAQLGIVAEHQPKNTVGKNASDIALVIDAMDLMYSDRFTGFVLVSSDSDFTRLAQRLREQGADVYGMGEVKTPEAFRMACKQFITVENLLNGQKTASTGKSANSANLPLNHAYQLISNVLAHTSDPDGWASLAWLGSHLVQQYPDFDQRSYGYKRLSDLVQAIEKLEFTRDGEEQKVRSMG